MTKRSSDITAIVTTFNRPKLLKRAIASVKAQTLRPRQIVIADDGEQNKRYPGTVWRGYGRAHNMFLTWYQAVDEARTEFVALLHDDDWYEPTFLERTRALMADDVAYVFTEATVHIPGQEPKPNIALEAETGLHSSRALGDFWLRTNMIITPSCVLYRRKDLLACLVPGNVPGFACTGVTSGPDHLMALLPLLQYPRVGWIAESQVNLDGGEQSTTIRELARDGGNDLQQNYAAARMLYQMLRSAADAQMLGSTGTVG